MEDQLVTQAVVIDRAAIDDTTTPQKFALFDGEGIPINVAQLKNAASAAQLEAYTVFENPLDVTQPIEEGWGEPGHHVLILSPTGAEVNQGLFLVGEDRIPIFDKALFDSSYDGSTIWVYKKYVPGIEPWTLAGPWLYGIYTTESCSLVELSSPGRSNSGMTMLILREGEGDGEILFPQDGHLFYETSVPPGINPRYTLQDACTSPEFYVYWYQRPDTQPDFGSVPVEYTQSVDWNGETQLILRFIPNTRNGGYWVEIAMDPTSVLVPAPPTVDGNYTLGVSVVEGTPTLQWYD